MKYNCKTPKELLKKIKFLLKNKFDRLDIFEKIIFESMLWYPSALLPRTLRDKLIFALQLTTAKVFL